MCSGFGETWGLSVNEAMNFGLPIVVSATCGCSDDLVLNGRNGYIFEEGNIPQLVLCLQKILENSEVANSMSLYSLKHIENYSISTIVKNLIAAN